MEYCLGLSRSVNTSRLILQFFNSSMYQNIQFGGIFHYFNKQVMFSIKINGAKPLIGIYEQQHYSILLSINNQGIYLHKLQSELFSKFGVVHLQFAEP